MRTFAASPKTLRLPLLALAALASAAAGCGPSTTTIAVSGQLLNVAETNYGKSGLMTDSAGTIRFCSPLVVSEFEVIITDFPFCTQAKNKVSNSTLFHSSQEANLRLIFPSFLQKNPDGSFMKNDFAVASTHECVQISGSPATAFFSHNTLGETKYDVHVEADSGTISVTSYNGSTDMTGTVLTGTYDLVFGSDHITGTYSASYCSGLTAEYGR